MNIGSVSFSPSVPLTVTAGEAVNLRCSVVITPHPLPANAASPVLEWFLGQTFNQPLTTTTTNRDSVYTSTYSVTSASESDGGMYICRLRGNQRTAVITTVTVQGKCTSVHLITVFRKNTAINCYIFLPDPSITVRVDADVATPLAGSMYSLTCTVTGADRLTGSTITYQWFKDDVMVPAQTMETFSFTSLFFSDAGRYTCQATVMSSLLSGPITTNNSVDVTLTCESIHYT